VISRQGSVISRRSLLLSSAAGLGCGRPKATGFPGFCFVANQQGRSVGVVDLNRFRSRKPIPLDAAPAAVLAHPAEPKAFVLAPDAGTVYEIDAGSLTVSRRVRAGNVAAGMQLSPGQDTLWVLYQTLRYSWNFPSIRYGPAGASGSPHARHFRPQH